ncbi:MAG: PilT/PilU family type 4a pilus ATPase [Elusimicrobia bacterium]|nr:PilT/PilU family type 4a pilus ATPase [Elusimicrobiota bacterium]
MIELSDILKAALEQRASDIFVASDQPPMISVSGTLAVLQGFEPIPGREVVRIIMSNLYEEQRRILQEKLELDCSFALPGLTRFRMNLTTQKNGLHAVIHAIPPQIPHPDDLDLPDAVTKLCDLPRGLVLVTGPSGSGKSTTLLCLLELINQKRNVHIVTVEDPIEFSFSAKNALICQREVGTHTMSYSAALKSAVKQKAHIVMIAELRDMETAEAALHIAEAGSLVFSTLSTTDSMQTVERIVNLFPPERHRQTNLRLAANLKASISQILLPRADGAGQVAAREIMFVNPTIETAIREGKTPAIYNAIEAGAAAGMINMDKSILRLARNKVVTFQAALERCLHPEAMQSALSAVK